MYVEGFVTAVPKKNKQIYTDNAKKAKEDEDVLFSWVEYPSKEIRDEANKKFMEDPEMGKDLRSLPSEF